MPEFVTGDGVVIFKTDRPASIAPRAKTSDGTSHPRAVVMDEGITFNPRDRKAVEKVFEAAGLGPIFMIPVSENDIENNSVSGLARQRPIEKVLIRASKDPRGWVQGLKAKRIYYAKR